MAILKSAILINYSTNQVVIMIFNQGLSLNQITPIVVVFVHDETCASKIFARKCKILNISFVLAGSHLELSLIYHIPAFVNTQTNNKI